MDSRTSSDGGRGRREDADADDDAGEEEGRLCQGERREGRVAISALIGSVRFILGLRYLTPPALGLN